MEALAVILPALLFFLLILGSICLIRKLRRRKEALSLEKYFENKEKEIARKEGGQERVGKRNNV